MKPLPRTLLAMSLLAFLGLVPSRAIDVGAAAPVITGTDQDGNPVAFADIYQKGVTLVYFYPKANTSGCTAEACSLRDSFATLTGRGLQIIGVSEDTTEAQKSFRVKYQLPFTLIADTNGAVADAFGVPRVKGFAKRQSFIVQNGKIAWRDPKASTAQQASDVGKALDQLGVK